jgi:hypothetical protein
MVYDREDCVAAVRPGECKYYMRSLSCVYVTDLSSRAPTPIDPMCVNLERMLRLSPVDERVVHPSEYWRGLERIPHSPEERTIGLYRVLGKRSWPVLVS